MAGGWWGEGGRRQGAVLDFASIVKMARGIDRISGHTHVGLRAVRIACDARHMNRTVADRSAPGPRNSPAPAQGTLIYL